MNELQLLAEIGKNVLTAVVIWLGARAIVRGRFGR